MTEGRRPTLELCRAMQAKINADEVVNALVIKINEAPKPSNVLFHDGYKTNPKTPPGSPTPSWEAFSEAPTPAEMEALLSEEEKSKLKQVIQERKGQAQSSMAGPCQNANNEESTCCMVLGSMAYFLDWSCLVCLVFTALVVVLGVGAAFMAFIALMAFMAFITLMPFMDFMVFMLFMAVLDSMLGRMALRLEVLGSWRMATNGSNINQSTKTWIETKWPMAFEACMKNGLVAFVA